MIENQRAPVMTIKIHEGPAHCLAPHPEGFLMCVGGDTGDLAMIQLSASLVDVTKAEKVTVATMLDRETRREKILSTLRKEDRLKAKAKNKMKMFISGGMIKKVKVILQRHPTIITGNYQDRLQVSVKVLALLFITTCFGNTW